MASIPDEWKWVSELPPSWEPPKELRYPARSPHLNLAVILLGSGIIGNDIIKLVGGHVALQAEFTIWAEQHDPPKSFKDKTLYGLLALEGVGSVYRCWLEYSAVFHASGGLVGTYETERAALVAALEDAIKSIKDAMNDTS
ncbi:hypothetical protein [Actinomadura sp. 3N508]|uniref:hypothetical protein n=1 Tax=Actinomadura sp. 3N508 TaxID=3375153 RepID=UPI0037A9BEDC